MIGVVVCGTLVGSMLPFILEVLGIDPATGSTPLVATVMDTTGLVIYFTLAILILGFFIDFVEISFIIVPILLPAADALGIAPVWFAILIAMNLQTSFLTPPFGFSLFYLKGVAPPQVRTIDIYKGVVPFILMQVGIVASILLFPEFYGLV